MPCFDASGIRFLPQSIYMTYQSQWATFDRIFYFNSNISTLRGQGDSNQSYYQFKTTKEYIAYTAGQQLHAQRYPTSNWTSSQNS
jgi:hypothetical protein